MDSRLIYAVVLAVLALVLYSAFSSRNHRSLPPGPSPDPLIGHARLIPRKHHAERFHEWGKKYGDVIYLNALGRDIIVLNSVQAATDLLDKRSSTYSDRPRFVMFVDILGAYPSLAFLEYGKRFQKHRRLFHSVFSRAQCYTFEEAQAEEARFLVKSLIEEPDSYAWLIRRYATTLVMKLAYGHQILSDDDEYIKIGENFSYAFGESAGGPGSTPPDFLPVLRHIPSWVPGVWWSRHGRDWRFAIKDILNIPFDNVRKQMAAGTHQPSFVATHLEALAREGVPTQDDLDDIKGSAGTIFAGGMETTWSTIMIFILAMTLFPDKQKKAQEEIDAVIGPNRLPEFSDRDVLPYLEALVQEVMRWYPAAPLGVPHRVMQDDVYKGMFIPKGSVIIANALGMAWDENVYPDPHKFYPERFLRKSKGGNEEPYPIGTFGFGRRACPGRHVADASVWIVLATMLATLDISKARGENGEEIIPEIAFDVGLTSAPKEFKCVIAPRTDKARSLVMQAAAVRTATI